MSGYKCELETGRTLKAQIDKRGWTVSIEGLNGDDWKPSIRSKAPIWEADKKWETLPEAFSIDGDEWNRFRQSVEVQEAEGDCNSQNILAKIVNRIPEWIEEHHFKTTTDTKKIYHYKGGVYRDDGETFLEELIESEFGDSTDNRLVADVVGKIKRRTYQDRNAFNNQNVVNVLNGLLDLDTLEIRPHSPECLSTAQIPVTFDPEAKAPRIEQFFREVAQPEDIPLIGELIGWLLWPEYNIHKALMLVGPGRNGKGTLLRLITAFLGEQNKSNVTLQDLVTDRFAKADLYGKLANIGGDLPSKDLSDTAAFRNLTGGDDNRAQEKYRAAFTFRNKAKMLFSANVLPRSPDDTHAFYSRWIILEFNNRFDPQKGTGDPDLDAKLQTPEELSGLLNLALAALARLREAGWKFSYTKTVEDVEVMYKRNSNPVYAYLLDECEPGDSTDYIEKTLFYNQFKEYVLSHNLRPLSNTKFVELLKDQAEIPVSTFRPWVDHGPRPMCWQGVRFKRNENCISQNQEQESQSTPSRVLPTPSYIDFNEGEEKESRIERVGLKQTIDGVDCKNSSPVNDRHNSPSPVATTILRFLQPVKAFVGDTEDMRTFGPFLREDVATVPAGQATNLIRSGHAIEVHANIGPHPRRDAPTPIKLDGAAEEAGA